MLHWPPVTYRHATFCKLLTDALLHVSNHMKKVISLGCIYAALVYKVNTNEMTIV
ncbi:hypothetical protein Mapa_002509 [Marchantia paleacea]|nr:hypothetical protein Mapa_002509 [Marchantia paleacea]